MALGYVGYTLRSLPLKAWAGIKYVCSNELQIRYDCPLFNTALQTVTKNALESRGPRVKQLYRSSRQEKQLPSTITYEVNDEQVLLSASEGRFWGWIGGKLCYIHLFREQPANNSSSEGLSASGPSMMLPVWCLKITVVFGSIKSVADEIARQHGATNEIPHIKLNLQSKYGPESTPTKLPLRDSGTLLIDNLLYRSLRDELLAFRRSEKDYALKGLPWRYNLLLSGNPGSGKTSLAHVLASDLRCDLNIIPVSNIEDDGWLAGALSSTKPNSITLIEDCTSMCEGETVKVKESKLTFSGILNCLDGFLTPAEGRIIILTTNYPDRLDPVMMRSGRIHKHLYMPLLSGEIAREYAQRVWGVSIAESDWEGRSPADLIQYLRQRAEPSTVQEKLCQSV